MAGPFCGMQLADLGADVVKVEHPRAGDFARLLEPLASGESGNFARLNRNKRGLAIDLKREEGRAVFRRLAKEADVIVENLRPGTMEDLGLEPRSLLDSNPRLIYVAVTGWGLDGPYAASDRHFIVGATTPPNWTAFCRVLGLGALESDSRYGDANARRHHRAELVAAIEQVTRTRPAAHWLALLRDAGVPCGEIADYGNVFEDPHLLARKFFIDLEHPVLGALRGLGSPLRLERTPVRHRRAGPLLGEHSAEVLREIGCSDDDIDRLASEGIIARA